MFNVVVMIGNCNCRLEIRVVIVGCNWNLLLRMMYDNDGNFLVVWVLVMVNIMFEWLLGVIIVMLLVSCFNIWLVVIFVVSMFIILCLCSVILLFIIVLFIVCVNLVMVGVDSSGFLGII